MNINEYTVIHCDRFMELFVADFLIAPIFGGMKVPNHQLFLDLWHSSSRSSLLHLAVVGPKHVARICVYLLLTLPSAWKCREETFAHIIPTYPIHSHDHTICWVFSRRLRMACVSPMPAFKRSCRGFWNVGSNTKSDTTNFLGCTRIGKTHIKIISKSILIF